MSKRLTPQKAADRLGVCRDTIYEYIKTGILPAKRRGPGPRAPLVIEEDDLEALLRPVTSATGIKGIRTANRPNRATG